MTELPDLLDKVEQRRKGCIRVLCRAGSLLAAASCLHAPMLANAADIRLDVARNPAAAMISLTGPVAKGDLMKVQEAVEAAIRQRRDKPIVLALNSPGGNHFEGMLIGLFLKRKGVGTVLLPGALCASACAPIFFGGSDAKTGKPNRVAYATSQLGVHRMARVDGREMSLEESERVVGGAGWFLNEVRVSKAVTTKLFETASSAMYFRACRKRWRGPQEDLVRPGVQILLTA
jgi:hypothetical protein